MTWGRLAQDVGGASSDDLNLAAGGEVYALRAGADGLEQWWVGLLHRLRQHPQVINAGVLAVEGKAFFCPRLDDYVNGLIEAFPAGVYVYSQAVEFLLLVTRADAEIDAARC